MGPPVPNIAKWFERIVRNRILEWCNNQNIAIDEQSGFMKGRRLETRILSRGENLRLTIAACNRPALTIFVDFLSASDRMWYPELIKNLNDLGMPLPLLKWVHFWLQNRYMYISFGEANSRIFKMNLGAPQGSVLAATLLRLHIHFLPSYLIDCTFHLFADDLAIVISGSLEKRFSLNINEIQEKANEVMNKLEKFSSDLLLPVNVAKTKAMLVHSVVSPTYPKIQCMNQNIEYVKTFKYLGAYISMKLGWGIFINERIRKIRKIYKALRIVIRNIPTHLFKLRRRIFLAYALPHFCWLFCCWFFFTDTQMKHIEHVYYSGLRIVYCLNGWDDISTSIITREKTLPDYIYSYWLRLRVHLMKAPEALACQQSWKAFEIATSNDKTWYKSMGFRRNSVVPNRLARRARHTLANLEAFEEIQKQQYSFLVKDTKYLNMLIYKFYLQSP
jgi:hypothetical protein